MRKMVLFGILWAAIGLPSCISTAMPSASSVYLDGGLGSEYGNFGLKPVADTVSPTGERCVTFTQDRPLSPGRSLRVTTQSCGTATRMECREVSRVILAISQKQHS